MLSVIVYLSINLLIFITFLFLTFLIDTEYNCVNPAILCNINDPVMTGIHGGGSFSEFYRHGNPRVVNNGQN